MNSLPQPMEPAAQRAALYARSATTSQRPAGDGGPSSLDGQLTACARYGQQQGYRIVERYADTAGGLDVGDSRPALQRLLQDAEAGAFDVL